MGTLSPILLALRTTFVNGDAKHETLSMHNAKKMIIRVFIAFPIDYFCSCDEFVDDDSSEDVLVMDSPY